MDELNQPPYGLLGGPLHRAGRALNLVRGESNTVRLGIAIGLTLWLILGATAAITGVADRLFSLSLLAAHLRLLVVIPLLFLCESLLEPEVRKFVRDLVEFEIVRDEEIVTLRQYAARLTAIVRSWWPDAICFGLAVMGAVLGGVESVRFGFRLMPGDQGRLLAWANAVLAVTVFRFLLFRWVVRLVLWTWFLYRVARLRLRLVAVHPDRSGGLGKLELVHLQFLPLVMACSVIVSATLAEDLATNVIDFRVVYPTAALTALAGVMIVFGPLCSFVPTLFACRVKGFTDYMAFASRYVNAFDRKWIGGGPDDELLGTGDIQSLADLSNSVNVVRELNVFPAGRRLLVNVVVAAVLPFLPLVLFQQSISELTERIAMRFIGS